MAFLLQTQIHGGNELGNEWRAILAELAARGVLGQPCLASALLDVAPIDRPVIAESVRLPHR